ncbi:hypothetical protein OS493_026479 [Desmophyllum pertusum]|uniref:Uncharacterized protein n=1 Tax=Desmophyllum pertusum TaxID=174260 RepID=A0A9W9Z0B8_9CNID|nr:hypothetical protein OS493_026479 [Desmophyllum pertusum]
MLVFLIILTSKGANGRPPTKGLKYGTKLGIINVPIMKDARGVLHETTAREDEKSYLTGPAYRILNKDNSYDSKDPFIFFPLIAVEHPRG